MNSPALRTLLVFHAGTAEELLEWCAGVLGDQKPDIKKEEPDVDVR